MDPSPYAVSVFSLFQWMMVAVPIILPYAPLAFSSKALCAPCIPLLCFTHCPFVPPSRRQHVPLDFLSLKPCRTSTDGQLMATNNNVTTCDEKRQNIPGHYLQFSPILDMWSRSPGGCVALWGSKWICTEHVPNIHKVVVQGTKISEGWISSVSSANVLHLASPKRITSNNKQQTILDSTMI